MDIPAGARRGGGRGETVRVVNEERSGDTVSVDTAVSGE